MLHMGTRLNYRVEFHTIVIGGRWFKTLEKALEFCKECMRPEYAEKCYIYQSEYDNDNYGNLIRVFTKKNQYILDRL